MTTQELLGLSLYETHGAMCDELVNAGYNLNLLYTDWGDFRRIYVFYALYKGIRDYDSFVKWFNTVRVDGDVLPSKQLFTRNGGFVSKKRMDSDLQAEYNRQYRLRTRKELEALRELTAKTWIDNNLEQAQKYISDRLK